MRQNTFIQTEKCIVESFKPGLLNDAFDTIEDLLDANNLKNSQITEIMLSVFKAGKSAGKEALKQQIASLR